VPILKAFCGLHTYTELLIYLTVGNQLMRCWVTDNTLYEWLVEQW